MPESVITPPYTSVTRNVCGPGPIPDVSTNNALDFDGMFDALGSVGASAAASKSSGGSSGFGGGGGFSGGGGGGRF